MLITFKTRAQYPNITMFGDIATELLKLMGRQGTVPGAVEAEDIPAALQRLRDGLASQQAAGDESDPAVEDEDAEPLVSIGTRAGPLIELLEAAAKEGAAVMWEGD